MSKSLQDILNGFTNGVSAKDFMDALKAEGFNIGSRNNDYTGKSGKDLTKEFKREEAEAEKKRQRDMEYSLASNKKKQEMLREEMSKMNKLINQLKKDEKDLSKTDDDRIKAHEELNELLDERNRKEREFNDLNVKTTDKLKAGYELLKSTYDIVKKFNDPWAKVDEASSTFAKNIGLARSGLESLRKNTIENAYNQKIGIKYDVDASELIKLQQDYIQGTGRNIRVSNGEQETIAAMSKFVNVGEWGEAFDKFGVNIEDVGEHVYDIFSDASKKGISFEKYSQNVVKNISVAQNYSFKDGIKGLERMAQKSAALRLDMQAAVSLASKVNSVEGAIDVASKLQVLGGPFANFADPMGMLNEGLNDIEGLQDRMAKMIGGLGTFNKATGEVEVSAFNKRRIAEAAGAMGISSEQLMDSVNAQARRREIGNQISTSKTASGLDKDMQELIKNSGTFKDGKAGVSINGQFKSIDELTNNDYEALVKETQTEGQDIKDIAQNVRSLVEKRSGFKKQKDIVASRISEKTGLGKGESAIVDAIGKSNVFLSGILIAETAVAAAMAYNSFKGGIGRGGKGGGGNLFKGKKSRGFQNNFGGSGSGVQNAQKVQKLIKGGNGIKNLSTIGSKNGLQVITKSGQTLKGGKALASLGKTTAKSGGAIAGGALSGIITGFEEFGGDNNHSTGRKIRRTVGSGLGGWGGAAAGAAIGSAIAPGVGTVIGGIIGGLAGSEGGKVLLGGNDHRRNRLKKKYGLGDLEGDYSASQLRKIYKSRNSENGELIKTKLEEGKGEKIKEKSSSRANEVSRNENPKANDFNLTINGTLKLEGKNGDSIDIIDKLKKDPALVSQLTDMIKKKMLEVGGQAYTPGKKANLYQV